MKKERRYDVDWIRVLVFDLLILIYVCTFFAPMSWHIKNNEIVEWLYYPMKFSNFWRIPILFVISGIGTRYAFAEKTARAYLIF